MPELIRDIQYSFTGSTEVLNGISNTQLGGSLKFYLVTIKDSGGTPVDITTEDTGDGNTYEVVLRLFDGLIAYDSVGASGLIYIITDAHAAPSSADMQSKIREVASVLSSDGSSLVDISGSTVENGLSFTVAAS